MTTYEPTKALVPVQKASTEMGIGATETKAKVMNTQELIATLKKFLNNNELKIIVV